jgi:hypothetical protein
LQAISQYLQLHEVKLTNLLKVLVFVGYSDFHALFTSVIEVCCLNMQGVNVLIIILPHMHKGRQFASTRN